MRRETLAISKGGRALLQGRGPDIATRETAGQMLQRVMPDLMGMKHILVLNDEAHHCYREKPSEEDEEGPLKGDDRTEAEKNKEAARVWISGLEIVRNKLGIGRVIDLSATPFFLRGSGYAEGTLFPWTVSDFSLMDAIECGIVKLPRVPVADNIPSGEMPAFRNLWHHIGKKMPKKGRGKAASLDPLSIPVELETALQALYGHYACTFELWRAAGIEVPPCFIVVCNNTSTSKLVHDYISGFRRENEDGSTTLVEGRLPLFRNFDAYNPTGSTMHVRFNTSKKTRWETDAGRCHVNWVVCDSEWEAELCRVAEAHPRVRAYVKNHGLGLEVPYRFQAESRTYVPDFIVLVDDGHGAEDLLHLVVEIKGYRREDAREKADTMRTYWVPGVNGLRTCGRWDFVEFGDVYAMQADFAAKVEAEFADMIERRLC